MALFRKKISGCKKCKKILHNKNVKYGTVSGINYLRNAITTKA